MLAMRQSMTMRTQWLSLLGAILLMFGMAADATAAGPIAAAVAESAPASPNAPVCTNFSERAKDLKVDRKGRAVNDGLLSEIYQFIKDTVGQATKKLFVAFTSSSVYQQAVFGAMSLAIVFFGIGFTIGVVQLTYQQALIRLMKFAIIGALISPSGWNYFNTTIVEFFNGGTDQLVSGVMAIGTGTPLPPGASPFYQLDSLANFILQPDTIIALLGSFLSGGPFGAGVGALLLVAMTTFVKLLINALRTYAVSFVAKSLILGVAPIFFIFLLFDKTKNLFTAWINALINLSLQPILLFTFLSFFILMIQSATKDMLNAELCWSEGASVAGTTNKLAFWKFVDPVTKAPIAGEMTWKGSLDCIITGKGDCPEFPINIIDILTFLILIYIADRFAEVTKRIATDLSNAVISLDAGGRLEQFLAERNKGGGGEQAATARSQASSAAAPSGGGGTQRSTPAAPAASPSAPAARAPSPPSPPSPPKK